MSIKRALAAVSLVVLAALPAGAQDFNANPNFGTVNLRTGFTPDPRVVAIRSGGNINFQNQQSDCRGYISNSPDVRLNFEGGSLPLILSVNSRADTTLIVNAPDGRWYCDDDGGNEGLNPSIRFNNPRSGRYEIWIGTYGSASYEEGELHISELYSQ